MKVVQIQDEWAIDNLTLTERHEPEVGPGRGAASDEGRLTELSRSRGTKKGLWTTDGHLAPHTDLLWRWRGYSDR